MPMRWHSGRARMPVPGTSRHGMSGWRRRPVQRDNLGERLTLIAAPQQSGRKGKSTALSGFEPCGV